MEKANKRSTRRTAMVARARAQVRVLQVQVVRLRLWWLLCMLKMSMQLWILRLSIQWCNMRLV